MWFYVNILQAFFFLFLFFLVCQNDVRIINSILFKLALNILNDYKTQHRRVVCLLYSHLTFDLMFFSMALIFTFK